MNIQEYAVRHRLTHVVTSKHDRQDADNSVRLRERELEVVTRAVTPWEHLPMRHFVEKDEQ